MPIILSDAYEYGVLDFAGGSIVGVNWPVPFGVATIIWLVAEWAGWRVGKTIPLGSVLLFVAAFIIALNLIVSGAFGFVSAKGAVIFWTIVSVPSAIVALVPAVAYALIRKTKKSPKAPDLF